MTRTTERQSITGEDLARTIEDIQQRADEVVADLVGAKK